MKELIIVGGGFAGLKAALSANYEIKQNKGEVQVTLISPNDFIVIRPRLYEQNPEKMKAPLQSILEAVGINFVQGKVTKINRAQTQISVQMTRQLEIEVSYDNLILAAGSVLNNPPIPGIEIHSWNIDTYEAAVDFDSHLLKVASFPNSPGHNRFVILGAGITGIELATELRSRIQAHSNPETAKAAEIYLIDQADTLGPAPTEPSKDVFEGALAQANVTVRLGQTITNITAGSVTLDTGEVIETASTIVTTGLRANPLAELLGLELDPKGRLTVDDSLRIKGVKNIFAAGDIAAAYTDDTHLAAMSCQHAMPMGAHAGYNAARSLLGLPHRKYAQRDYRTCIDLGESGALLTSGWDRIPEKSGPEVKAIKCKINQEMIYPPEGNRERIMAFSHIDAQWVDSRE
jgi:NADH:ubiquinone reductase (H+-translocating)